jgi:LmbE family N-acetylglucosaminyl deacetylase
MRHDFRPVEGDVAPRRIERLACRIRGLKTIGTVLHIGAHPDDEDAGLIAYMARKHAARTVYWSATRGESGQNRLGRYTGEALGVYRTWESLAARAIDGGESLFGPFYDFGYSKHGAEAAAKWDAHALVREIVRAIRLVQPLVLVARFSGNASDGHGQHQAIGSATAEAFTAAGDTSRFGDLDLPGWRVPKMYLSVGGDWQPGEEAGLGRRRPECEREGFVRIDTGELDPAAGLTYQQMAWMAFNCHRTQAMGFLPQHGSFFYYFELSNSLVATSPREDTFYDGLDATLMGLADHPGGPSDLRDVLRDVCAAIDRGLAGLRPDDPVSAGGALLEGLGILRGLRARVEDRSALARQIDAKVASFQAVIVDCLGIDAECLVERAHVAPGECLHITGRLYNPRGVPIERLTVRLNVPPGWTDVKVERRRAPAAADRSAPIWSGDYDLVVPADAPATTPHWLERPREGYRYVCAPDACEAVASPGVRLECELSVSGQSVTLRRPALRREPFAGGYRELPVSVVPPVSIEPHPARVFLPADGTDRDVDLHVRIRRYLEHTTVLRLSAATPSGWPMVRAGIDIPAGDAGEDTTGRFRMHVPGRAPAGRHRVEYVLDSRRAEMVEPVWMAAPGLPRAADAATCVREAFLARTADVDVHVIDARFARGLSYGYVSGNADGMLDALEHFGLDIRVLSGDELGYLDLSPFAALVIGPNAYLLHEELRRNAARVLDYVHAGGTLLVQYQAYGYELHQFAPFPFTYSHPHDRVTYADAPVQMLDPTHPLMTHPNRLSHTDFAGWVHDRGLYFFGDFDARYTPLLACNDPGEDPKRGGLVVAGYGRGAFIYVAYSLFRQIPAGVSGAFRLLGNLLSYPEALLLQRAQLLKPLSLFAGLTDDQLMAIARIVSERYVSAGTSVCRKGDRAEELFVVLKGVMEIVNLNQADSGVLRAVEGQIVGEFAILADLRRTADLRAGTDLHLLVMSGVHFRALLHQYPAIAEDVIRQLVLKAAGESPT